ncbi:hypothetical protein BpHYR1_009129 [Brachionus plicatilis]|uniref:Uncharacterized protein n=1 Tax=Brachionus plicatilis TaxID=10195 RepID=A0A3M7SFQ3_BRAPC|nr:hypothetical protein BpHYR1_009129 [Brachionus plicatilis]
MVIIIFLSIILNIVGIKEHTIISELSQYRPVESTLIDSMHSIFFGVVKHLMSYWFESPSNCEYSLKSRLNEYSGFVQFVT